MDNVTLTFLNALADMLGILPQKPNQTVSQQNNRGGITSAQSRGRVTSSRQRGLRSQNSTANVTRQPPSDIVRSPGGQLARQNSAIVRSPGGALTETPRVEPTRVQVRGNPNTANPGPQVGQPAGGAGKPQLPPARQPQGYMDTSQRVPTNRRGEARTRLTQAARGTRGTGVTTGRPAPTVASRLGAAAGPALLNTLAMFLGGKILESAGSEGAANMSLLGGDAPVYGQQQQEQPKQQSETRQIASTAESTQPRQPRQVRYPTAAETIAASQPAKPVVPEKPPAAKRDWRDVEYMQARKKAMAITDPVQRQAALEGVTQMGLEFHRDYYGK